VRTHATEQASEPVIGPSSRCAASLLRRGMRGRVYPNPAALTWYSAYWLERLVMLSPRALTTPSESGKSRRPAMVNGESAKTARRAIGGAAPVWRWAEGC